MITVDAEDSLVVAAAHGAPVGLVVVDSPDAALHQRFVPLAAPLVLGRSGGAPAADTLAPALAIDDARMSRRHVELRVRHDGAGCEARDLDSRNGTFVDGARIASARVGLGGVVRAGDSFFAIAPAPLDVAPHDRLCGRSFAITRVLADIARVAAGDAHILVEGETGTGKELVAEVLHARSARAGRFVAVNCAAIPAELAESYLFGHRKGAFTGSHADVDGVFEQAHDGTLLLDEIGELRLDLQAKLLRVLETRQVTPVGASVPRAVTARIVSATNAALRIAVAAGTFRADLFARLAAFEIAVPPLRARRSDVPLLAAALLARAAPGARIALSANALDAMLRHGWPLNVRELRSLCGRLALAHPGGGVVRLADVAPHLERRAADCAAPAESAAPAAESSTPARGELATLLRENRGNVVKLAAHYGKDRKQIYRWLAARELAAGDFR